MDTVKKNSEKNSEKKSHTIFFGLYDLYSIFVLMKYQALNGHFDKNTHHPVGIACELSLSITVLKEKDPPSSSRS